MQFHGRLDSSGGVGVNNMIKNGAILTTNIYDILSCYPQFINKKRIDTNKVFNIKKEYKEIYNLLEKEPRFMDELLNITNFSRKEILLLINSMETDGLIEQNNSGEFKLKIGVKR